jgi:hypothetical protein
LITVGQGLLCHVSLGWPGPSEFCYAITVFP